MAAFHPESVPINMLVRIEGTPLFGEEELDPLEFVRTIAVARLMLDNFPHVKAYWIMLGLGTAQTALAFGADDLDALDRAAEQTVAHGAADADIVVALTDIHGRTGRLAEVADDLAAADVVLLTGDLTHFGGRREAAEVVDAVRAHNPEVLAVAGNCDRPEAAAWLAELAHSPLVRADAATTTTMCRLARIWDSLQLSIQLVVLSDDDLALLDQAASLSLAGNQRFQELRSLYLEDMRLRVPPILKRGGEDGAFVTEEIMKGDRSYLKYL